MVETESPTQPTGWRISKACQECRKRKIKCNGETPCKMCQLRNTPCLYRDVTRSRKRKHQDERESTGEAPGPTGPSRPESLQPAASHRSDPPLGFNTSVSATHMASPSSKVQLYYGSTSHFALINEIYRDLTANPASRAQGQGRVEEAGAGLDMFSFRCIYFGIPLDSSNAPSGQTRDTRDLQLMFLPYHLASEFLQGFLYSLHQLMPIWSAETFQHRLEKLYDTRAPTNTDQYDGILLMALALGSCVTEHHAWGDVLYERVKASCSPYDDNVTLQSVQLHLIMAHYQNERARPNSCFLHLGSAARKALSAGMHKESPSGSRDTLEYVEERRRTFWYLFAYETWICFHLGRPRSLLRRDIDIALPDDAFLHCLVFLSDAISRSVDELYGRHHDSLLEMWRIAKSVRDDLRSFDYKMQRALGFGLDKRPQPGRIGVQQAICNTLYYHTILLTFRPFLIFRGRWSQNMKLSQMNGSAGLKRETPAWLNEACDYALSAACRTIYFLCESYTVNELVREIRYHSYFLGSSSFALIFDLFHGGKDLASTHLPWVHASLRALSTMRLGDPSKASIAAISTVLKQINPAYEWTAPTNATANVQYQQAAMQSQSQPQPQPQPPAQAHANPPTTKPYTTEPFLPSASTSAETTTAPTFDPISTDFLPGHDPSMLYDFQGNPLEQGMHMPATTGSAGASDELDFTQSDMGWDFDFSSMDLGAFLSLSPSFEAALL
ncbi:C6 zinc finger domain protein [Aspergillus pseudoustus]|uniref:C6 zinc finger domain protein n=1 Tax=Aspergillus pseudoustus TaxID=1810923 RepID=A0ABR4IIW3_9EURO